METLNHFKGSVYPRFQVKDTEERYKRSTLEGTNPKVQFSPICSVDLRNWCIKLLPSWFF